MQIKHYFFQMGAVMEKNKRMSVKNEFYYYIVLYYIILMKHNIFLEEIDKKETEYYISVKEFIISHEHHKEFVAS